MMPGNRERGADGTSFLARLRRDRRGNVLAIVGVSLIPLLALLGSGVDMTRAYMAQSRLQQACDAAALAGRRVMTGGVVDSTVTDEAKKFFNFNFPQLTWGTTAFVPTITQGPNSTVVITASTTISTEIMRLFGFDTLPLSVTCDAKQDFVNTDIVLVLDTTGSMADKAAAGDTDTKIVALRKAVLALYDQLSTVQTKLEAAGLRLRYAVVPFSSGMNVGAAIRSVNPAYLVHDTYTYQSRIPIFKHVETGKSQRYCDNKGGATSDQSGSGNSATYTCTYSDTASASGTFDRWQYQPVEYNVANYVRGVEANTPNQSALTAPNYTGPSATPVSSTWAGCIEERQTVSTITGGSGYTIPSGAYDLNVDMIPTTNKATQWAPYWPEVEFRGDGADYDYYQKNGYDVSSRPQVACPAAATRLRAWTRADLSTYLNTLTPTGGTYHDNGMIWGARFLSANGIFRADNPATYNGMPVSRQVIYMTDGIIDTGATVYSTYGEEFWDKRVTGGYTTDDDSDARHDQRFRMMCAATKQMGVSIWVIAFASTLTDSLSSCATSASQASISANSAALTAKFVQIGKSIGALRLTQ